MRRTVIILTLALLAVAAIPARATQGTQFRPGVTGTLGVIATESPAAARVGRGVLEAGGNAVDAAAATVFALNVARPQSCGIGGGGFMVYRSHTGKVRAVDFREEAPAAIQANQFSGTGKLTERIRRPVFGTLEVERGVEHRQHGRAPARIGREVEQRRPAPLNRNSQANEHVV